MIHLIFLFVSFSVTGDIKPLGNGTGTSRFFDKICSLLKGQEREHAQKVKEQILEYVETHASLHDIQTSINEAVKFVKESYAKQQHEHLDDHIETIRQTEKDQRIKEVNKFKRRAMEEKSEERRKEILDAMEQDTGNNSVVEVIKKAKIDHTSSPAAKNNPVVEVVKKAKIDHVSSSPTAKVNPVVEVVKKPKIDHIPPPAYTESNSLNETKSNSNSNSNSMIIESDDIIDLKTQKDPNSRIIANTNNNSNRTRTLIRSTHENVKNMFATQQTSMNTVNNEMKEFIQSSQKETIATVTKMLNDQQTLFNKSLSESNEVINDLIKSSNDLIKSSQETIVLVVSNMFKTQEESTKNNNIQMHLTLASLPIMITDEFTREGFKKLENSIEKMTDYVGKVNVNTKVLLTLNGEMNTKVSQIVPELEQFMNEFATEYEKS